MSLAPRDDDSTTPNDATHPFRLAHFPVELRLPLPAESPVLDARAAIRSEFRDSSRWMRLRCRKVSVMAERERGSVYAVHVGASVDFDWTWEGAVAFRPHALGSTVDGDIDLADFENSPVDEASLWSGEILEVDEQHGCLFLRLNNPENPPVVGSFFVRPFDFLGTLDDVYHEARFDAVRETLGARLIAAAGGVHPLASTASLAGLPELRTWWRHAWAVLWGPPGTGKTYTLGRQVASVVADPDERVLVVSTTNRATDAAALSLGRAVRDGAPELRQLLEEGNLLRVGQGAAYQAFRAESLDALLQGTEADSLRRIDGLAQQLPLFDSWEDKAYARKQIAELRANSGDRSRRAFVDADVRAVVATAYKALRFVDDEYVRRQIETGEAPFTTVIIDEAGLISRAAVAALSLLASRRVVLVGDSKQLAPISRVSRLLPTRQETWLARSGLSHLDRLDSLPSAVHVLTQQRRMHEEVCRVVSQYQYDGVLTTAPEVAARTTRLPSSLAAGPRAIWYVLDEDAEDLASLRAERGPSNRSWVRPITLRVLAKLLSDGPLRELDGMFISPFKAQAQAVSNWFVASGIKTWRASTVHAQQGAEADVVVFDTVYAGSHGWPFDEWKRLINVGMSRAREAVVLLASRAEMDEPYLRPLIESFAAKILVRDGHEFRWQDARHTPPTLRAGAEVPSAERLGGQIAQRRLMQPVLSREQQRLANLTLDGKPRLVRGVAGSGKTFVLSNWLAKTAHRMHDDPAARIWAVYANRSLHNLLRESIEAGWRNLGTEGGFPWSNVSLWHVKDVLDGLLPTVGLSMSAFGFEYDRAAEEFLNRQGDSPLEPLCRALFIDEAQDLGPNVLRLLLSLVEQTDSADRNSRSAHIFFDNAQNIYGRKPPKWSEFGLDLRGRSAVMRESFRSTQPIMEFAVNVLHRLAPAGDLHDHQELLTRRLLERTRRGGADWLRVRFNQVHGPKPIVRSYDRRDDELSEIGDHVERLVRKEQVAPSEICVLYNGPAALQQLETRLKPRLAEFGVELSVQKGRSFERRSNTLLVTTSHSFKGYDAEVVIIPCADQFATGDGQVLAANLYVAMTRARSLLAIYLQRRDEPMARRIRETLESCSRQLAAPADVDEGLDDQDALDELLARVAPKQRRWLAALARDHRLIWEPIIATGGRVLAQPLFWFVRDGRQHAVFADSPPSMVLETLRQHDVESWTLHETTR